MNDDGSEKARERRERGLPRREEASPSMVVWVNLVVVSFSPTFSHHLLFLCAPSVSLEADPLMENLLKFQENQNRSLIPSPNSHSINSTSNSSSNNSNSNNNGFHRPSPPTPTTPKPITRLEPNSPYATTFVQADTSSFKQVVQMLTGSSETAKQAASKPDPPKNPIPPIKTGPKKQPSSKLYEQRNSLKNFKISPLIPGLVHNSPFSPLKPATPEILSPSILNFSSLVLSPVTPLILDPFGRSPLCTPVSANLDMEAEKAMAGGSIRFDFVINGGLYCK